MGGPSTAETDKKAESGDEEIDQPEVQDVSTLTTAESSSSAGIPETPVRQW